MLAIANSDWERRIKKGDILRFNFLENMYKDIHGEYALFAYIETDKGRYPIEFLSFKECETAEELSWVSDFANVVSQYKNICLLSLNLNSDKDVSAEYLDGWLIKETGLNLYNDSKLQSFFHKLVRDVVLENEENVLEIYSELWKDGKDWRIRYRRRIYRNGKCRYTKWIRGNTDILRYNLQEDRDLHKYIAKFLEVE